MKTYSHRPAKTLQFTTRGGILKSLVYLHNIPVFLTICHLQGDLYIEQRIFLYVIPLRFMVSRCHQTVSCASVSSLTSFILKSLYFL